MAVSLYKSVVVALGLSLGAMAVQSGPVQAKDTMPLAQEYTNLPSVQKMIDEMFSAETMASNVAVTLPPSVKVTEDQLARIGAILAKGMDDLRPDFEIVMTEVSAELFSVAELQALIDFYQSEHGATIMGKMQPMMQQTMSRIGPKMQEMQKKTGPQIAKILQEKP